MVAHHEPVTLSPQTDQAQVEWRFIEQIKPGLTLLLEQGLQARFMPLLRLGTPIQIVNFSAAGAMNDLQHVFAHVPAERGAQRFMPPDHCLPGLREPLRVKRAVDAVTVLHVIQPGTRLQQGVQQHPLLHRGHRVHVFNQLGRHRQGVQLCLTKPGQREVRRRQAASAATHAMGYQRVQFTDIGLRQLLDDRCVVTLGAECPAQQ